MIRLPFDSRELADAGEMRVGVSPSHPRGDTRFDIEVYEDAAPRNLKEHFNTSKTHEAEITTRVQVPISRKNPVELRTSSCQSKDGHEAVDRRDHPNNKWPNQHQRVSNGCVVGHRIASDVLIDVETMSLDNVLENHLQKRNTETDGEIDQNSTALLSF